MWRSRPPGGHARARYRIPAAVVPLGGRVVCVTSGKGGTGKSVVTTNLSVLLAREGRSVALLDADLGLANAHLLLDVAPPGHLLDLLDRNRSLDEIAVRGPAGVRLVSGGSGVQEIACLSREDLFLLIRKLERLRKESDLLLVDTSAGIGPQTLMFAYATREIVLVATKDLTSLTDAYAIVKTLVRRVPDFRISLVVNRVRTEAEARRAHARLRGAAAKFLGFDVRFLGYLHEDESVAAALARKRPVVELFPECRFSRGLRILARRLEADPLASQELPHAIREAMGTANVRPEIRGRYEDSGNGDRLRPPIDGAVLSGSPRSRRRFGP